MFKSIGSIAAGIGGARTQGPDDAGIKRVFMVLHGFYGNLFLSKFSTGSVENGEDQGIANARRVWAHSLADYDADTVKLALRRCQQAHPEFPPSLPQFVALCSAIKPREVYQPPAPPALTMSPELREKLVAEQRQRLDELAQKIKEPPPESGLNLLKQAIARAVADAGGDEALELLRLDRMLAPRCAA
jgi:hypothetical protein